MVVDLSDRTATVAGISFLAVAFYFGVIDLTMLRICGLVILLQFTDYVNYRDE